MYSGLHPVAVRTDEWKVCFGTQPGYEYSRHRDEVLQRRESTRLPIQLVLTSIEATALVQQVNQRREAVRITHLEEKAQDLAEGIMNSGSPAHLQGPIKPRQD